MRRLLAAAIGIAILTAASAGSAQTVYPIDRADILAGSRFDLKVEFAGIADPAKVAVTLNDKDHAQVFGKAADFVAREDGKDQSALILRDVSLMQPGVYKVRVTDGTKTRELAWNVYDTGPRKAKNVILFIGDGMSLAHRVAARHLAKGIAEGKALGKLTIDDMPHMALVATAGSDSIVTDSANSASAYATGHKTVVNAMGVYGDRTADPLDDPKVETISSLVKRRLGMAVGIVTNTEIEDATPRRWWPTCAGAANTTASWSNSSQPSPTSSWAAARRTSCRNRPRAASAGTNLTSSRNFATPAIRSRSPPRSWRRPPTIRAPASCWGCSRSATWMARSIASSSSAAPWVSFRISRT